MSFDHYAALRMDSVPPSGGAHGFALVSGFVDGCTQQFASAVLLADTKKREHEKKDARQRYQQQATTLKDMAPPKEFRTEASKVLLLPSWLAITIEFELKSPWYSRDDRPFHVLDNPVRKDRVFGVPFMSASSWQGLLRCACRMEDGLLASLTEEDGKLDTPQWIVHLFGNAKGEDKSFSGGALRCYPTWFDKVAFEVINPHDRARRAGTQPITYEVVPAGSRATLHLLYAPTPGQAERQRVNPVEVLVKLLEATNKLLTVYGFSARRTVGWGIATVGAKDVKVNQLTPPALEGDFQYIIQRLPGWWKGGSP